MASEQTALPISTPGGLTAFRHTDYDVPFWARPNTRDGRWNRAGDDPTQYWSLSPEAAWAELIRFENLHHEEELDEVRKPLWVCRVEVFGLLDLRTPGNLEQYGLTADQLVDDDRRACQEASARIRSDALGVITPSAALPGHANLTLFGPRRAIDWKQKPSLASTLPATIAAVGRPPFGMLPMVRRPLRPRPQSTLF